ncbi:hypothetical protein SteCoe_20386 [Stentor coeruleus]|uniref:RING-type domain-containing protein n=1 Tax=Stentor coeruleus TaxID=5963 RepID=A0A1R2BRZ6_9CILI|nr:hypothetical protein SteCoe_20386 [Stentor coeruleus]
MLNDTTPNSAPFKTVANYITTFEHLQSGAEISFLKSYADPNVAIISTESISESLYSEKSLQGEENKVSNLSEKLPKLLPKIPSEHQEIPSENQEIPSVNQEIPIIPNLLNKIEEKKSFKTSSINESKFSKRELNESLEETIQKPKENTETHRNEQEENKKSICSTKDTDFLSLKESFNTVSTIDTIPSTDKDVGKYRCSKCSIIIMTGKEIILACKHYYHFDCLNKMLEGQLKNAKNYNDIHCIICPLPISIMKLNVLPCFKGYKDKYDLFVDQYSKSKRSTRK